LTQAVLKQDPLDFRAGYESYLAKNALAKPDAEAQLKRQLTLMRADVHSFLELAVDYSHAGLWDDAISILSLVPHPASPDPR
jgi:hypothetical protein